MVEFSEKLDKKFTGAQALSKRVAYRTQFEKYVIPYTDFGVDYSLFNNTSELLRSLREVLGDLDVKIQLSGDKIVVADLVLDSKTLEIL